MTEALVVISSCDDAAAARQIADTLVREDLAACVSLVPGVESIYRWQGQLTRTTETLLIIKCLARNHEALSARLHALHPYTVPELLALPVTHVNATYLAWMEQRNA